MAQGISSTGYRWPKMTNEAIIIGSGWLEISKEELHRDYKHEDLYFSSHTKLYTLADLQSISGCEPTGTVASNKETATVAYKRSEANPLTSSSSWTELTTLEYQVI